jgi:hypothetical protein
LNEQLPVGRLAWWGRWWHWIVAGALYGMFARGAFGDLLGFVPGVVSKSFLIGTPFVVGALAVYGLRKRDAGLWAWIGVSCASATLMMFGCMVTLLEGSICLVMISPLILACACVGGVAMGVALKLSSRQTKLQAVVLLPFVMALGELHVPSPQHELEVRRSTVIDASAQTIWHELLNAKAIRAEELPFSLTHFIGVPRPIEGVNVRTPEGEIRFSRWDRGVHFRGMVTHREENKSITWRYLFDKDSFPPGSMDDHVAIGGRYFDVHDTTFNLVPLADGTTKLEVIAHYRVSTNVNFYAVPVARFFAHDFVDTLLGLYKMRSERGEEIGQAIAAGAVSS